MFDWSTNNLPRSFHGRIAIGKIQSLPVQGSITLGAIPEDGPIIVRPVKEKQESDEGSDDAGKINIGGRASCAAD